jgi:pteridine reductase
MTPSDPVSSLPTVAASASAGACWALVTGASGRGGAAISRALHARGLSVVIHHTPHSLDHAEAVRSELETVRPGTTRLWSADFAAVDFEVPAWIAAQGISVLVCNASAYRPSAVGDIERLMSDVMIHVGANASILMALRPPMSPSAPAHSLRSVVAITDIAVDRAPKGHVSYTTAKGALQTMILALANDWAPYVRFNVVQPGTLPFPDDWTDEDRAKKIVESIPLGRLGSFEELAGAVVYLALDATYVTGQVLAVDGGRSRQMH